VVPAKLVLGAVPVPPDTGAQAADFRDELFPRELPEVLVHAPSTLRGTTRFRSGPTTARNCLLRLCDQARERTEEITSPGGLSQSRPDFRLAGILCPTQFSPRATNRFLPSMSSLLAGRLFVLIACVAAFAAPAFSKARYIHATTGNIDIVSSMSEERTTRFLHELVGLRKIAEDLLGTAVVQPSTQIIVFDTQNEMDEFFPERQLPGMRINTKWYTATSPEGEVFSIISEWPNDKVFRQAALKKYAMGLISRALPECPYWIYEGLAATLCTLEYRDGLVRLGESTIDRRDVKFVPAARLPLAETLGKAWNSKDVPGLWHMWLTEDYEGNRPKIRQLAELIRHGAKGDADTLSQAFGQPVGEIQAALYKHLKRLGEVTTDRPALTNDLRNDIVYRPATELETAAARSLVLITLEKRQPGLMTSLTALAQANPDSPRPLELLARLATADKDQTAAERFWLQACENKTANPYAYLVPLRATLEPRMGQISLNPSLTSARAAELRQLVDTCAALNPGQPETFQWGAWIEALAPDPKAERVDRVAATHARYLRPGVFLPLVIANIRLQRFAEATNLLDEYERIMGPRTQNQAAIAFLRKKLPAS
jgi:hypothetical protein